MAPAAAIEKSATRGGRQPARYCGAARKHNQGECRRGAGWGTDHPGFGHCRNHGGSTPSGRTYAAKLAALASARADYGGEVDADPLEALLYTVRRGSRLVAYWQAAALKADTPEEFAFAAGQEAKALADLSRWAKNAVDGGVAERQVLLAERFGETIVAAAEEALAALEAALGAALTAEARTAYAAAFGAGLSRLEAGTIDVGASDVDGR